MPRDVVLSTTDGSTVATPVFALLKDYSISLPASSCHLSDSPVGSNFQIAISEPYAVADAITSACIGFCVKQETPPQFSI